MPDLDHLRGEILRLRAALAIAFQEAEEVVLDLAKETSRGDEGEGTRRDYTVVRLNLMQANHIRDLFLRTWQELSKED